MPLTRLAELRAIARERIAKRKLPRETPSRMWGGRGGGQPCVLCDQAIQNDEVECEIEAPFDNAIVSFRFHMVCQSAWQLEMRRRPLSEKAPVASRRPRRKFVALSAAALQMKATGIDTLTDVELEWMSEATQQFRLLRPGARSLIRRPMRDDKGALIEVHFLWANRVDRLAGKAAMGPDGQRQVEVY